MVRETSSVVKGKAVKEKLHIGCGTTVDAVVTTYGPYGRNVALTKLYNPPHVTKDGVTVVNGINLTDPIQNIAAQIIKSAAKTTVTNAGDGTTSTSLLSGILAQGLLDHLEKSPSDITKLRELQDVTDSLLEALEELSTPVTSSNYYSLALIASNGDQELAKLVADTYSEIGPYGIISVADSKNYETFSDTTSGIKLDRSHIAPVLVNNTEKTVMSLPYILVTDLDIKTVDDAIHLLQLQELEGKPLLVICNDIEKAALEIIAYNKITRGVEINIIRAPYIAEARIEACRDLAIATGGTFVEKAAGWRIVDVTTGVLGSADQVEIGLKETNIIGRHGNEADIKSRVEFYKKKIKVDPGLKPNYEKRLAILTAGAAVIYVGGANEVTVQDKKDRLDDTIRAIKAATEKGYLTGGCWGYNKIASQVPQAITFGPLLTDSLKMLEILLLRNRYGADPSFQQVKEFREEVLANGIIEPTLVVVNTVKNAVEAAIMIASVDCAIVKHEEDGSNTRS